MFDDRPGATTTTANKKNSKEDKLLELSEF
jgi:hypothetical protein